MAAMNTIRWNKISMGREMEAANAHLDKILHEESEEGVCPDDHREPCGEKGGGRGGRCFSASSRRQAPLRLAAGRGGGLRGCAARPC